MSKIKDLPKYVRPREKALTYGIDSLSDSELLALLIGSGGKDNNVIDDNVMIIIITSQSSQIFCNTLSFAQKRHLLHTGKPVLAYNKVRFNRQKGLLKLRIRSTH